MPAVGGVHKIAVEKPWDTLSPGSLRIAVYHVISDRNDNLWQYKEKMCFAVVLISATLFNISPTKYENTVMEIHGREIQLIL